MAQLVKSRSRAARMKDRARARKLLRRAIRKYPILKGTKIVWTSKTFGHQAICYYASKRIFIHPLHVASLEKILEHELGHIVDWHDNHKINWGENLSGKVDI